MTTWTHTPDVVRQALDSLRPSGGTAVYDATLEALPLIARRNRERGALLIVSDGSDTASTAGLREVRTALRRSQAFVYAIAIDPPDAKAINRSVNPTTLREITDESGGRTEVVQTSAGHRRGIGADRRRAEPSVRDRLHAAARSRRPVPFDSRPHAQHDVQSPRTQRHPEPSKNRRIRIE